MSDRPLPMTPGGVPLVHSVPDRSELIELVRQIVKQARMPIGRPRANYVKVPSVLIHEAIGLVDRELRATQAAIGAIER